MMMTSTIRRRAIQGFTLIELLIVVIIIAILAAIAIPQFSSSSNDAQVAAMSSNLNTVRSAIELYRVQHNNVYPGVNVATGGNATCTAAGGTLGTGAVNTALALTQQLTGYSNAAGATCTVPAANFPFGPYLRAIPTEPISNDATIAVVTAANAADPDAATGGWRYNTALGRFQVNSNAVGTGDPRPYFQY